jgi:hypothetical protein
MGAIVSDRTAVSPHEEWTAYPKTTPRRPTSSGASHDGTRTASAQPLRVADCRLSR